MKKIIIPAIIIIAFFSAALAHAAAQPIAGADVIVRERCASLCSSSQKALVATLRTDASGSFEADSLDLGQMYDVYYGNESLPPVASLVPNASGVISGKLSVEITSNAPATPAPFVVGQWSLDQLLKLRTILINEKIIPSTLDISTLGLANIKTYIKAFQKKYNITQTGTLGPITTKKLNDLLSGQ